MSSKIVEDQFFRWTSGNFYRTSYNDMGSKVFIIIFIIL